MNSNDLNTITNQITTEYLCFTGKGEQGKLLLSPMDYLAFRNQAFQELANGVHVGEEVSSFQTVQQQMPLQNREKRNPKEYQQANDTNSGTSDFLEEVIKEPHKVSSKVEKIEEPQASKKETNKIVSMEPNKISKSEKEKKELEIFERFNGY